MDLKRLIKKLKLNDDNFDEWLKDLGLLHRDRKYPYGDHEVKLRKEDGRLKWILSRMSYTLRNRNINVIEPKNDGIPVKRHAIKGNSSGSDEKDEPKPKRQALADLNSVLSNQLLIDSTKKPLELKKRSKRITASDEKLRQTTIDNENIFHDEVILPEVPTEDDPCPEVDFEKESESDPYAVSTYARDIFRYYKHRERFFKIGDYLKKQSHINRDHRAMLVDWMVGVQESFELNHETLYLAVKLVDMFLDHVPNVAKEDLQLLAGTSVFIAAKFDERSPPLIDDILYICEDAYSRDQLLQMERDVLCTIGFDLGMPLSYRFLRRYARVIKLDMPTLTLARYVLETSLMFYEFVHVSESLMAASSLLLALRMKHMGDWSLVLQKYSGLKLEEVEPLMYRLNHMIIKRSLNFDRLQIIYQKYCHEVFHSVAAMPSLESPIPINEPISAPPELGN